MKLINTRSLVATLGLSLLTQGAWAQTAINTPPPTAVAPATAPSATMPAISAPAPSVAAPTAPTNAPASASATASSRQTKQAEMAKQQQALLGKLNLSPAQKIQYDAVQAARQDLRKQKQASMVAHQKTLSEQVAKEQMDPRVVIEADQQSRSALDAKRVIADQKWLAFWDGLTPEQRKTFTTDMKVRQEHHAQRPHGTPRS